MAAGAIRFQFFPRCQRSNLIVVRLRFLKILTNPGSHSTDSSSSSAANAINKPCQRNRECDSPDFPGQCPVFVCMARQFDNSSLNRHRHTTALGCKCKIIQSRDRRRFVHGSLACCRHPASVALQSPRPAAASPACCLWALLLLSAVLPPARPVALLCFTGQWQFKINLARPRPPC